MSLKLVVIRPEGQISGMNYNQQPYKVIHGPKVT